MTGLELGRPLTSKIARNRLGVECIRAQAIDGFGRKRDQLSVAK